MFEANHSVQSGSLLLYGVLSRISGWTSRLSVLPGLALALEVSVASAFVSIIASGLSVYPLPGLGLYYNYPGRGRWGITVSVSIRVSIVISVVVSRIIYPSGAGRQADCGHQYHYYCYSYFLYHGVSIHLLYF